MSESNQWWYCLRHRTVEETDVCANSERLGPYATRQEAEQALQTAAARTEAWESDPDWNDD